MPGMDGSGFLYQPLSRYLTSKGFDSSIEPLNPHKDKRAYIEHLEQQYSNEPVVLIAESYSGHIATELALRGNLEIEKLVIIASFLENPSKFTSLEKYLSMGLLRKPLLPKSILGHVLYGRDATDELILLFKQAMQDVSTEQLATRIADMRSLELPANKVSVPTVYIQGAKDWLVPAKNLESYQKVFTQLEVLQLDSPHLVAQAKAKECAEIIESFIKKTSSSVN